MTFAVGIDRDDGHGPRVMDDEALERPAVGIEQLGPTHGEDPTFEHLHLGHAAEWHPVS